MTSSTMFHLATTMATIASTSLSACHAFTVPSAVPSTPRSTPSAQSIQSTQSAQVTSTRSTLTSSPSNTALVAPLEASIAPNNEVGNLHGQGSCFLPLLQNEEDYIAPRIIQIAGAYPGVTPAEYLSVTSEPPADLGQWTYDFSDPDGPQLGTVALPGMTSVYECEDPVVLIADHFSMGVQLPKTLVDPVDLVVLCDRSKRFFSERKFLVMELPGVEEVRIGAFQSKGEMPGEAVILGQVMLVQIPWLPSMQKKKSGFMEEDEYFSG